ncbi:hypothetical protein ABLE91_27915 [Aquabacter sp. CN5-332]|uniref:hypothetical protein n=1 Tax=Aquabacter sp. CN5-332 TaxID=3156608 RepID=UPI0032B44B05
MTNIESIPYCNSSNHYAGADRVNMAKRDSAYSDTAEQQAETETGRPPSVSSESSVDGSPSAGTLSFQRRLVALNRLDASNLKPIDISELPEDRYQSFIEGEEARLAANKQYLESQYTDRSWMDSVEASLKKFPPSGSPATAPYATVVVGGKVVATIDNQGVVTTDDALGEMVRDILLGEVNDTNGPDLAQARADQIAEMLGGRVSKASTGITQDQFNALPAAEAPKSKTDYDVIKNDPAYAQLQKMYENLENLKQQRDAFLAR